jgi:hypothetical protein
MKFLSIFVEQIIGR